MKHWKCNCGRDRWTEDNIVMTICLGCAKKMHEVEDLKKRKEVGEDERV